MAWSWIEWHRQKDALIAYSGMDVSNKQHHSHEVTVVFSEWASAAWGAAGSVFDPVSDRLLRVRLNLHTGFMSTIKSMLLQMSRRMRETLSVEFFQVVQEVVTKVPGCYIYRGMVLVIKGLNACVGKDLDTGHGQHKHVWSLRVKWEWCTCKVVGLSCFEYWWAPTLNCFSTIPACHQYTTFYPTETTYSTYWIMS